MASVNNPVEVAVIDEIQMLRDVSRGWAWTRALLGIPAKEVHVCGEEAAVDIVKNIISSCYESVEVKRYQRLNPLTIEDKALMKLDNVEPGDCIVCFSKPDIFRTMLMFDKLGIDAAVIYGSLPPETKIAQAKRFNDPNDPCKVLVATDAIGMGLNLNIRRVIFYSLRKVSQESTGERSLDLISVSSALQIGGRAGRYSTEYEGGFVTTLRPADLKILKELFNSKVEPIPAAGIYPTNDQIEMFSYHLPQATLSNLLDIFVSLCRIDSSSFFMCYIEDMKYLADLIQHVQLPLRVRFVFACAPINVKSPYVCTQFIRFSRMYSDNEQVTLEVLHELIGWPLQPPRNMFQLALLEDVFDVLDLYLWLSYRFADVFPDRDSVREMQKHIDSLIYQGITSVAGLLKEDESNKKPTRESSSSSDPSSTNESPSSSTSTSSKIKSKSNTMNLTEKLIASGLLSPEMVRKLKEEWRESENDTNDVQNRKK